MADNYSRSASSPSPISTWKEAYRGPRRVTEPGTTSGISLDDTALALASRHRVQADTNTMPPLYSYRFTPMNAANINWEHGKLMFSSLHTTAIAEESTTINTTPTTTAADTAVPVITIADPVECTLTKYLSDDDDAETSPKETRRPSLPKNSYSAGSIELCNDFCTTTTSTDQIQDNTVHSASGDSCVYTEKRKSRENTTPSINNKRKSNAPTLAPATTSSQDENEERFRCLLKDPQMCMLFREYLKQQLCWENLSFWIEVENFKATPPVINNPNQHHSLTSSGGKENTSGAPTTDGRGALSASGGRNGSPQSPQPDPEIVRMKAMHIYNKYFSTGSKYELNVEHSIVKQIRDAVTKDQITLHIFDKAQTDIFVLMLNDSYPKFLLSSVYLQYRATLVRPRTGNSRRGPVRSPSPPASTRGTANLRTPFDETRKDSIDNVMQYFEPGKQAQWRVQAAIRHRLPSISLANMNIAQLPCFYLSNGVIRPTSKSTEFTKGTGDSLMLHLRHLDLSNNNLSDISPDICTIYSLVDLDLNSNKLYTLTPSIGKLSGLTALNLSKNSLRALPDELGQLTALRDLKAEWNTLTTLPSTIGCLRTLQVMSLTGNPLLQLPASIVKLGKLGNLEVSSILKVPPNLIDENGRDTFVAYLHFLCNYSIKFDNQSHWVSDHASNSCQACKSQFTNLLRRHHCRLCGQLFCSKCSNKKGRLSFMGFAAHERLCTLCVPYLPTKDLL